MTAVDVDALAELREALAAALADFFHTDVGPLDIRAADALLTGPLAPLIAEVRKLRALRDAMEGLVAELWSWPSARILSPHDAAARIDAVLGEAGR